MLQTVSFDLSYWVKLWKLTAYHKIIHNFENGGRIFTHSPNHLHANLFQNIAKCTYFYPKTYLRGQKMYLVNNVLENQIWAVPLLHAVTRTMTPDQGPSHVTKSTRCWFSPSARARQYGRMPSSARWQWCGGSHWFSRRFSWPGSTNKVTWYFSYQSCVYLSFLPCFRAQNRYEK